MLWVVEPVPQLNGFTVEWAESGNYFLSRHNRIFHSVDLLPPFTKVATVSVPLWKRTVAVSRLAQRLLRFFITNVIPLKNGELFVTFDRYVGIVRDGKYQELKGLVRPCRVLRSACAADNSENIFFGEYLANDERDVIRIYRYSSGKDNLEVVHTFPRGSIKHVHGLYFDQLTNFIYCLTGDNETECQILRSDDGFKTISVVGSGDETWRAVSLLFDMDKLYYGTDAEFRTNNIFSVDRKTLLRNDLGKVTGTVFYSKRVGDDLFFTTTAENAPSQIENVAAIWQVSGEDMCEEIVKFEKDWWHPTLFGFGTIHFPAVNNLRNELYFTVVGVKQDDKTFRLKRLNVN